MKSSSNGKWLKIEGYALSIKIYMTLFTKRYIISLIDDIAYELDEEFVYISNGK
jgi:hypothetical protein